MAGLIGRSIDLHYGLAFSLFRFLDSTPPLSVLVRREGKRLLAPVQRGERKRRGGRRIRWNRWIALLSLSFIDERSALFLPFRTFQTRHDALGSRYPPLSLFIHLFVLFLSLSFSLPFSRHFVGKSTLDSRIDAPLERSSSYPIRFFLSYIHLALTFPRSYWKIKILSFFLSAFRRENIARRGVTSMDGWNEQIFFEN